ncbi:MAG: DUF3667 domain-containing protein [Rubrivivax sp.]
MPTACLNCEAPLPPAGARFCPACGQETNVKPPTLREFAQQLGGAYLSTEGALWRTLKLLVRRPGELTRQYLAGRRKHYVLPLRLYLTVSVLVLLALRLTTAASLDTPRPEGTAQRPANVTLNIGNGRAGIEGGAFFCRDLPQWFCTRLQRRLDLDPKSVRREMAEIGTRFMSNLGAAMFVLVPAFAGWQRLAWWNRGLRYTEHLVFALHLHAFWFLMLGLSLLPTGVPVLVAMLAAPVHAWLAERRVYGARWWVQALRDAFVGTAYAVTLGFVLTALAVWTLLF